MRKDLLQTLSIWICSCEEGDVGVARVCHPAQKYVKGYPAQNYFKEFPIRDCGAEISFLMCFILFRVWYQIDHR